MTPPASPVVTSAAGPGFGMGGACNPRLHGPGRLALRAAEASAMEPTELTAAGLSLQGLLRRELWAAALLGEILGLVTAWLRRPRELWAPAAV